MQKETLHWADTWMRHARLLTIGLACLLALTVVVSARDRAAARQAYQKAVDFKEKLDAKPEARKTLSQYKQAIFLFRLVVDHDPTYGAADDSLYSVANLYAEMAEKFENKAYTRQAIRYYEMVAREYPATKHRKAALQNAAALRQPVAPLEPEPAPVVPISDQPKATATSADLAELSEVRYWSNKDYTRVVLQLDREVEFRKSILTSPDRIYFDLLETAVSEKFSNREFDVNGLFIKRVRIAQNRPNVVRVVLDFEQINQHMVFAVYDPYRIVIDTRGKGLPRSSVAAGSPPDQPMDGSGTLAAEAKPAPPDSSGDPDSDTAPEEVSLPTASASPTADGDWTLTRTLGLKVSRVVIDPGHGGKDTGTIGPSGLLEKDLVLQVSLKLKELLEKRLGIEAILTRDDDTFIPLEERTAIANQKGADLFISVHANASRNRKVSGIETYVLDFATSDAEREAASRENASSQRTIRELEDLLKQITSDDYNQESRDLAKVVQRELFSGLNRHRPNHRDRGVKQAPFIVLIGSNMPSILTEIGFISNPGDEKFYKSDEAKEHVAEALYQGVANYFQALGALPATQQATSSAGR